MLRLDPISGRIVRSTGPLVEAAPDPHTPDRRQTRGLRRKLVGGAIVGAALMAPGEARSAITVTVIGNLLGITGDAEPDTIVVTDEGGQVKVNGLDPGSGPAASAGLTSFIVNAGDGPDLVDLSGVSPTDFPALGLTNIDGGIGNDTLTGTGIGDNLIGGLGDDVLNALLGDQATGSEGNDTLVVRGTPANDTLTIRQSSTTPGDMEILSSTDTMSGGSNEILTVDLGPGNDSVTVADDILGVTGLGALALNGEDGDVPPVILWRSMRQTSSAAARAVRVGAAG